MEPLLSQYTEKLIQLPDKDRYAKEDLLTPEFLIDREGDLEVYYAAHNEYINQEAMVILLGITPGWQQMERSLYTARQCLLKGLSIPETLYYTKLTCRFIGTMRANIIKILNELKLHKYLGIDDSKLLFSSKEDLLHSSSCIRFPVFYKQLNYTGHTPKLTSSQFLLRYVEETINRDVLAVERAIVIPFGKAVEEVLSLYVKQGVISADRILFGFPHPSGANGQRYKQFERNKEYLTLQLKRYFSGQKGL